MTVIEVLLRGGPLDGRIRVTSAESGDDGMLRFEAPPLWQPTNYRLGGDTAAVGALVYRVADHQA